MTDFVTPLAPDEDAPTVAGSSGGGRVVVGVDGSPGGAAAVRFALAEARLRGAELQVVNAWHYPDTYGALILSEDYDLETVARRIVSEAITAAIGDPERAGVVVTTAVPQGRAASVLLAAAADADLLVVGSRGHGGFTGLLLGSVSQQCVHHGPCPVVVVPTSQPGHGRGSEAAGRGVVPVSLVSGGPAAGSH